MNRRIVVGISGASGAVYAQRLIQQLLSLHIETHLVASPLGVRLLHDELGMEGLDLAALAGCAATDGKVPGLVMHNYRDMGAKIASGSFLHDGMVIIPCSSNSLAAVATGNQQNLLHRAAHVALKERRKLVLVHREMPLSLVDIRNYEAATQAGAIICPANPGWYMLPRTLDDIVNFVTGRVLDLLQIEHKVSARWGERTSEVEGESRGQIGSVPGASPTMES
ncbi:MAG: UbiX family flavin prenyltransferase [Phycisphaerales bacterium]|nr:UbiX family flavin prenyltransferase [Phycisphaerales bacterium]